MIWESCQVEQTTRDSQDTCILKKEKCYLCDMAAGYQHTNRHKYYLKCHMVFCVKYRKRLLVGHFNETVKHIFNSIAEKSHLTIEILETDIDHVHFLISYPPNISVSSMVRRLKQESTIRAWYQFEGYLRREFWKERTLWSDGYFVCSIGEANTETVRRYIENQGKCLTSHRLKTYGFSALIYKKNYPSSRRIIFLP